ncbi:MAG: hypothetical protein ISR34_11025 [Pirellulales bacterium]|nr:hypothetical protein [Pirellulales bacterium]
MYHSWLIASRSERRRTAARRRTLTSGAAGDRHARDIIIIEQTSNVRKQDNADGTGTDFEKLKAILDEALPHAACVDGR